MACLPASVAQRRDPAAYRSRARRFRANAESRHSTPVSVAESHQPPDVPDGRHHGAAPRLALCYGPRASARFDAQAHGVFAVQGVRSTTIVPPVVGVPAFGDWPTTGRSSSLL